MASSGCIIKIMDDSGNKILLVEDEPDVCNVIESYLGRRGYTVTSTASGKEALPLAETLKPDIVLLDFTLQDMNGKEALSRLRKYDNKTKVIVITGEILSDEEIEKIKALGISAYLQKPLLLGELERIIAEVLGRKSRFRVDAKNLRNKANGDTDPARRAVVHELKNILGIIRNKCENFTLNINDGIYKDKSDKEIIDIALETMNTVIKTVDRASKSLENIPKTKKKGR